MDGEPDELARRDDTDEEFAPRRRAWVRPVAWVAVVALVLGAGFSSALALLVGGGPDRSPGRGATVVSEVIEERGAGTGRVAIQAPPADATAVFVRFTCLSAGEFSWGPERTGNPTSSCTEAGVGSERWHEFPLPETPQLYITADEDAEWSVQVVYISRVPAQKV